tara:strand:+ start:1015 stop:1269 length:255 start_codon:yes stop_codon:yes gene_type:complete
MATPQELYDETKTRLDNNLKKSQLLNQEIQQKEKDNQKAIKIVQEIQMLRNEANILIQPIIEDQGALKQLEKLSEVVKITEQNV